ncbi:MAG: hypothetical protein P8Y70_14760 [Candidatus Lokiarchaeota archaeon]
MKGDISTINKALKARDFELIGHIPEDQNIINFDKIGYAVK